MSFYLTGNPVPSASMPDVHDNAQNLDFALNEITSTFWTDRLGRRRMSWFGIESAFTMKLTDFESRFDSRLAEQESVFAESLVDKENRFQQFLGDSGYVFLGDYEDGPFQFSARNQYIRFQNQFYRLNKSTDTGFTTTGTDETSFANDVTHLVLMDGDTLRQNLGSGDGDPIVAPEKVRAALGGTVSEAIRYVSVDGFEPDLTGTTDSTLSVLKAAAVAKTLADSAYVTGDTKYYVVRFGFGAYMLGDVPLYTGITYEGQDNGSFIIPKPGAKFCLTTTGTEPYATSSSKRLYNGTIKNLRIGCAFRETVFPVPAGVGGINIEYASYIKIENVEMRMLNGPGLDLKEVWDSDINIRMMKVGNITDPANPVPALRINMGSGTDGSNALRFWGLHIEECPKSMQIEPGSRHIFFNSPKIEGGTITSTIVGAAGLSFSGAEFTWARNDIPQFSITRTDSYESFGVVFDTPQFNSGGLAPRGWYIHHEGNSGHLLISNPIGKFVKTMVSGNSWISRGGVAYACGPDFMKGTWSCTVDGLVARAIMKTSTAGSAVTDGTGDFIVLSGGDNVVRNCKLHSAGAIDDGLAFINILGCNNDVACNDNSFSGSRQYGIRGSITSYKVRNNSLVDSGTLAATMSAAAVRYSLTNPGANGMGSGGFKSANVTISAGAAGSLDIISGATTLLIRASSALGFAAAKIFVDANFSTVALEQSLGGIFATGAGTPGDGKVYITKSGSNLILTNYNSAATFYVMALSAVI